jgi:non-ribosomal peptide synthetase component F
MSSTAAVRTPVDATVLPARPACYAGDRAPTPRTLVDILHATAAAHPTAPAIDDGSRVLDYTGLLAKVERLGARLGALGIGRGDRVGVRVPSGTSDLYVAILAVLSIGAAYVPVDVDDPPQRVAFVWAEAGVCAVVGRDHEIAPVRAAPAGGGRARPIPTDDAWVIFTPCSAPCSW